MDPDDRVKKRDQLRAHLAATVQEILDGKMSCVAAQHTLQELLQGIGANRGDQDLAALKSIDVWYRAYGQVSEEKREQICRDFGYKTIRRVCSSLLERFGATEPADDDSA